MSDFISRYLPKFSGSDLKLIAALTMLIDHIACYLLIYTTPQVIDVCCFSLTYYDVLRGIGRVAMPIYCFLLVEGLLHTHDVKQYVGRMLLLTIISEPIWDVIHTGIWFTWYTQSVMVTLTLGLLCLISIRWLETWDVERPSRWMAMLSITAMFFVIVEFSRSDYGGFGVLAIVLMYLLRDPRVWWLRFVSGVFVFGEAWYVVPYVLLSLYDGTRGFIRTRFLQWMFYFWYPLHLLVLYLLRMYCF